MKFNILKNIPAQSSFLLDLVFVVFQDCYISAAFITCSFGLLRLQ